MPNEQYSIKIFGNIASSVALLENLLDRLKLITEAHYDEFKHAEEPSLVNVSIGDLAVIPQTPHVSLVPSSMSIVDLPQQEGAEIRTLIEVYFFREQLDVQLLGKRVYRMGESLRRLYSYYRELRYKDLSRIVYEVQVTSVNYSQLLRQNFEGERGDKLNRWYGFHGGIISLECLYYESRY